MSGQQQAFPTAARFLFASAESNFERAFSELLANGAERGYLGHCEAEKALAGELDQRGCSAELAKMVGVFDGLQAH